MCIDDGIEHGVESGVLDESLDAVLPSWLVRLDTPPSSRDPLGLQGHSQYHADSLLPGLNVFTSRARYYPFLCWAIRTAQAARPPAEHLERLFRLERLLVLTEALRHENEPDACRYIGWRRGRRFVTDRPGAATWNLPDKILKNQLSNGAFRLYRTSLADLELIEQDELEPGLGVRLTHTGEQLADAYGKQVDGPVVVWALEKSGSMKRRQTVLDLADAMCLSRRPPVAERRTVVRAMFEVSSHALARRETARLLFEYELLSPPSSDDIIAEDADAVSEDGGDAAESAATLANWLVVSSLLRLAPTAALRKLQLSAAYQLAQLGLNGVFGALLDPTAERGRIGITTWLSQIAERAGVGFVGTPALSWKRSRTAIETAQSLLELARPWPERAMLGIELLLQLATDRQLASWLADDRGPLSDRILTLASMGARQSAAELLNDLVPDLVDRHATVSARKGKGAWLVLDGREAVRVDPRPMRPMIHALRFAQLRQLAADLELEREELADEA